jgi:multisubunit Na+/H+ antiporter MnhB subunit
VGALYAVGGVVVLIMLAVDVWNSARIIDRILEAMLVMAALCGVWFTSMALQNLGIRPAKRKLPQLVRRFTAH